MTRKVKIIDAETGRELRETYTQEEIKIFGFSFPDVVKGIGLAITVGIFLINSDAVQKKQQVTLDRLVDFRDNSDSFQTTVYGVRFKNGEPIDPNYKINNHGNIR